VFCGGGGATVVGPPWFWLCAGMLVVRGVDSLVVCAEAEAEAEALNVSGDGEAELLSSSEGDAELLAASAERDGKLLAASADGDAELDISGDGDAELVAASADADALAEADAADALVDSATAPWALEDTVLAAAETCVCSVLAGALIDPS
jgi:hypothetical protein